MLSVYLYLWILFINYIPHLQALETTIIPGNWVTSNSSQSVCKGDLIQNNAIWKLSILKDSTTKQGNFSYFLPNGTAIWGVCEAQNSSIAYGIITTNFSCNTSHSLFQNTKSNVSVKWDAYNAMAISLNITQSFSTTNENGTTITENNCSLNGTNITTYTEYGTWNVTQCNCISCCYNIGTQFIISGAEDIMNNIGINVMGTISGPYCDNTMVGSDNCSLTSTVLETDVDPVYNVTNITCNYMGKGLSSYIIFNVGTVTMKWGSCEMTAVPMIIQNTWGGYLRNFGILVVILTIIYE